jgi:hypothetical protein
VKDGSKFEESGTEKDNASRILNRISGMWKGKIK